MNLKSKFITLIACISLLCQTISPSLAYAQEATPTNSSPTPVLEQSSSTSSSEEMPIPSVTENPTMTPTETPVPTITVSPTSQTSSESSTLTQDKNQELSAAVVKNISTSNLNFETKQDSSATLATDKEDYSPTDLVLITGKGFVAGKTYSLLITSVNNYSFSATVNAGNDGTIIYTFQLDGTYRPTYKIEVWNSGTIVATTNFTDSEVNSITPSTNEQNIVKNWANVVQISKGLGTTDLKFTSTRNFSSCFEYRTDGDTSQILTENGGNNYNNFITDGLYPYVCVKNSSEIKTVTANRYVEVRMVFGAETDERFDWTRFDVLHTPAAPTNLYFTQGSKILTCGTATGSDGIYSTHLLWSIPDDETMTLWRVIPTYPSGSHGTPYSWTSGSDAWIGANIGQGYGAPPNDQGLYSYSVQYKNSDDLWSDPATCSLTYDSTAPIVTVTPIAGSLLHGTVTFEIMVNDDNVKPTDTVWVYLYNNAPPQKSKGANVVLTNGHGTFSVNTTLLEDGLSTLDIQRLADLAGNYSGTTDNYFKNYIIDNTRPSITFTDPSDFNNVTYNQLFKTGPNLAIKATDDNGIANTVLHVYNADNSPAKFCPVSNSDTTSCDTFSLPDGDYYVKAGATDNSGNNQTITKYFSIDNTAPIVSIDSPSNGAILQGPVEVRGSVADAHPHHYWLQIKKNGSVISSQTTNDSSSFTNKLLKTLSDDGEYEVTLAARDAVGGTSTSGNRSQDVVVSFTIDNTAPDEPTLTSPTNNAVVNGASLTNTWSSVFDAVKYIYESYHDSGATQLRWHEELTSTSKTATNVAEATFWWRVKAVDLAGNESGWSPLWKVTVDNTAPTTPTADPAAGDYNSPQQLTLSSSDTNGFTIYYTTDGSLPTESSTEYTSPIEVNHDMTIKAIAYDPAGNASDVLEAAYGIAPTIENEEVTRVNDGTIIISWTTSFPATSRVIYDTVSHSVLGAAPNYGYAFSTTENSTLTTSHFVTLTGLNVGTDYFYRAISHGSPETVGEESSYTPHYIFGIGTDTLGCQFKDCSGNTSGGTTPTNNVLGLATGPSYQNQNLENTRNPNTEVKPSSESEVLGTESARPETEEVDNLVTNNKTLVNSIFSNAGLFLVILAFLVLIFLVIYRRLRRKD